MLAGGSAAGARASALSVNPGGIFLCAGLAYLAHERCGAARRRAKSRDLLLALGVPVSAAVETVKGVLVDQSCYKADKTNTGEKHTMKTGPMDNCATMCAKMGQPVALLTAEGKLYQVTGDLAAAVFVAHSEAGAGRGMAA